MIGRLGRTSGRRFMDWLTRRKESFTLDGLSLVLVDMQEYFLESFKKDVREELISNQLNFLKRMEKTEIPLAILEYSGEGSTVEPLLSQAKLFQRNYFIEKSYNDGFEGTNLREKLHEWHTRSILLMGVNANFCVKETAESAREEGFGIVTSIELIGDHTVPICTYAGWFQRNGVYFPSYANLVEKIG